LPDSSGERLREVVTSRQPLRWNEGIKIYVKNKVALAEGNKKLYATVWSQCTDAMRAKLEGIITHSLIAKSSDGIELIKEIRTTAYQFQHLKKAAVALHAAKRRFYLFTQRPEMSNHDYLEKFQNLVEVVETNGGNVGTDDALVEEELILQKTSRADASSAVMKSAIERGRARYLATAFLVGTDKNRYGLLVQDLENSFLQKQDRYPRTLVEAYQLICNWKHDPSHFLKNLNKANEGLAFTNDGNKTPRNKTTCTRCGQEGHISPHCQTALPGDRPAPTGNTMVTQRCCGNDGTPDDATAQTTGTSGPPETQATRNENEAILQFQQGTAWHDGGPNFAFVTHSGTALSQGRAGIPDSWILLDNQSTVDVFCNPRLLQNIRQSPDTMNIQCTAGRSTTNLIGDFPGYGPVWYLPNGIANILSLSRVSAKYRVTYDSTSDANAFVVHKRPGVPRRFRSAPNGLFYFDCRDLMGSETTLIHVPSPSSLDGTALINTVRSNALRYSRRDLLRAQEARRLQDTLFNPSLDTMLDIVTRNLIPNCRITRDDVLAAEDIWGPNTNGLKGKTPRQRPIPVARNPVHISRLLLDRYRDVVLCADIMFVNGYPFLVFLLAMNMSPSSNGRSASSKSGHAASGTDSHSSVSLSSCSVSSLPPVSFGSTPSRLLDTPTWATSVPAPFSPAHTWTTASIAASSLVNTPKHTRNTTTRSPLAQLVPLPSVPLATSRADIFS